MFASKKFRNVETETSKGFLIDKISAENYCIKKIVMQNKLLYLQLYSSNIISTKGIIALVYEVEVRRNGLNKGFFI